MNRTKLVLLALATLAFAAWINAGQERRACGPCSVTTAMTCQFANPPR